MTYLYDLNNLTLADQGDLSEVEHYIKDELSEFLQK